MSYLVSGRPPQSLRFIPELFVLRMNQEPSQETMPDLTNSCPGRQGLPLFIHRGKLYLWRTKALLHPNLFSVSGLDSKQKQQICINFHNPQSPSWRIFPSFSNPVHSWVTNSSHCSRLMFAPGAPTLKVPTTTELRTNTKKGTDVKYGKGTQEIESEVGRETERKAIIIA